MPAAQALGKDCAGGPVRGAIQMSHYVVPVRHCGLHASQDFASVCDAASGASARHAGHFLQACSLRHAKLGTTRYDISAAKQGERYEVMRALALEVSFNRIVIRRARGLCASSPSRNRAAGCRRDSSLAHSGCEAEEPRADFEPNNLDTVVHTAKCIEIAGARAAKLSNKSRWGSLVLCARGQHLDVREPRPAMASARGGRPSHTRVGTLPRAEYNRAVYSAEVLPICALCFALLR